MTGRSIRNYTVLPQLPERLAPLKKLAYNLWWSWHPDAVALFRRIDVETFERLDNSPIKLLNVTSQARFEELAHDGGFLAHMDRILETLNSYMNAPTWFQEHYPAGTPLRIAYFSAEFGIHESIPEYSGGLGVLAGDHLKSASDMGLPLMGVSLMYRQGYMRQYLNADGWQQERYPENDFFTLPLIRETDVDGKPLIVTVPFPGREVQLQVWRIQVGRVPLYLLDANLPQNSVDDRNVTAQLYGGDSDTRIRQEMILGIGGIRALKMMGKMPTVCHMNEGHAAFVSLERIRLLMEEHKLDFASAAEAVKAGTCFTTHTPVPAGNDAFPPQVIDHYLGSYMHALGLERNAFLALGRTNPADNSEQFGMTVLALKLSNTSNGVSKLHGTVSRNMWKSIWPGLPTSEVPIGAITNGVHTPSWVSPELTSLFQRYLGARWEEKPYDSGIWKRIDQIPDAELWRTHERRRERLVAVSRARLKMQLKRRGAPISQIEAADEVLDPEALTIGFARRFATYKRGSLIFKDIERLIKIVNAPNRPVQFIFAGKSHPKDHPGKQVIAEVVHYSRRAELRRRVLFLEDYDMTIARQMVQGVDVWLNNPRRPLEASGTSGMKAAANGVLNLSILDGWWVEGYDGENGWAIGNGEEYTDTVLQDDVESRALYDLLEGEIVPLFYNRTVDGLPRGWLKRMKRCIGTLVPVFNTNRMVEEYIAKCYWPSHSRVEKLMGDHLKMASDLSRWRRKIQQHWSGVRVEAVETLSGDQFTVGSEMHTQARISLGQLTPDDVEVQICYGPLDSMGELAEFHIVPMGHGETPVAGSNVWQYTGKVRCKTSGQHGYCVRVLPRHPGLPHSYEPGLVTWG